MSNPQELHFKLDEKEFCRAHRLHLRRALLNIKNIGLTLIAILLIAGQTQVLGPTSWAGPFFVALWVALFLGVVYVFVRLPLHLYHRKPELQGEQRLRVLPDGLSLKLPSSEQFYEWKTLLKIQENGEFLLLYFGASLPVVIPKKIFDYDPTRVETFKQTLAAQELHS